MIRTLAAFFLVSFAAAAGAQLRTIPKEAELGVLHHLEAMVVEIDGKPRELAPGAQIRDPENRLVLPTSLMGKYVVRYLADANGVVRQVWILSEQEKAALPPPPFPK